MKALNLTVFKGRFGISQARLNQLVREGKVSLQQNGYLGDSPNHHKLVIFPDDFTPTESPRILRQRNPPNSHDRQSWLLFNSHRFRFKKLYGWTIPHGERKQEK